MLTIPDAAVIIPRQTNEPNPRYFLPSHVRIIPGQQIKWMNADNRTHNLIFTQEIIPYGIRIGEIGPKKILLKKFDTYVPVIDYTCALHPEEKGKIVMYPKPEREMSNTETLRHLTAVNRMQLPKDLDHLNHTQVPNYGREVITEQNPDNISLQNFLDPLIYESLSDPKLYGLQSKNMTIVFWDISGFSTLCNILKSEPIFIIEFLQDYFNEAIRIIHNNDGVVDKFLGDGIMAYFGFNNNNNNDNDIRQGAISAVNASLQLKKSFSSVKNKWLDLWNDLFGHDEIHIDLKCGIHTGTVLFGLLSMENRYHVTATGPTVNLASRLEGFAENSQIVISAETRNLINNKFITKEILLEKTIQSFSKVTKIFEVVSS